MEKCHKLPTDGVDESIIRHNVSKPLPLGGPPGQIKTAYYLDVGLKQMVPDQMWIKEDCTYNIAAIIKVFSMYGYDYMKKIVLSRVDLNEHIIAERDFKYLYPSDFEDMYLLNLQDSAQPHQTLMGCHCFEYKRDFTVIDSPRAVTFRDKYEVQMIMQFNEIHKFSDGTLHQIDEALDYRVKEFKVNKMYPGLNTRF
nr:hypothetical protein [Tanacetum cinerariifolium]